MYWTCRVDNIYVRLNLFNHLLVLFDAKFACNLAIRYPVFRWELCKGSVKKVQDVCTQEEEKSSYHYHLYLKCDEEIFL